MKKCFSRENICQRQVIILKNYKSISTRLQFWTSVLNLNRKDREWIISQVNCNKPNFLPLFETSTRHIFPVRHHPHHFSSKRVFVSVFLKTVKTHSVTDISCQFSVDLTMCKPQPISTWNLVPCHLWTTESQMTRKGISKQGETTRDEVKSVSWRRGANYEGLFSEGFQTFQSVWVLGEENNTQDREVRRKRIEQILQPQNNFHNLNNNYEFSELLLEASSFTQHSFPQKTVLLPPLTVRVWQQLVSLITKIFVLRTVPSSQTFLFSVKKNKKRRGKRVSHPITFCPDRSTYFKNCWLLNDVGSLIIAVHR